MKIVYVWQHGGMEGRMSQNENDRKSGGKKRLNGKVSDRGNRERLCEVKKVREREDDINR